MILRTQAAHAHCADYSPAICIAVRPFAPALAPTPSLGQIVTQISLSPMPASSRHFPSSLACTCRNLRAAAEGPTHAPQLAARRARGEHMRMSFSHRTRRRTRIQTRRRTHTHTHAPKPTPANTHGETTSDSQSPTSDPQPPVSKPEPPAPHLQRTEFPDTQTHFQTRRHLARQ